MQKIRKGDQVVVTTGKEKGKRGTVLRVLLPKLESGGRRFYEPACQVSSGVVSACDP